MDAYWRAANYLSVGQIYLYDNPLLKEPLKREHIKPRLAGPLGHHARIEFHLRPSQPPDQGARPEHDLHHRPRSWRAGHGGQHISGRHLQRGLSEHLAGRRGHEALVQAVLLSRRHSQPRRARNAGLDPRRRRTGLFACRTPSARRSTIRTCSSRAWSAMARPRPARWPRAGIPTSFSNPVRDGAVLPILHLNGYKIAGPTVLARIPQERTRIALPRLWLQALLRGRRRARARCTNSWRRRSTRSLSRDQSASSDEARAQGLQERPRWPMIMLRTPKGWTGPKVVDGKQIEGTFRAHQVPMGDMDKPEHIKILEGWMKSYSREELFDKTGRLRPELAELAPKGDRRMGANPHANGGLLLRDLRMPDFRDYAVKVPKPGAVVAEADACAGPVHPRRDQAQPEQISAFSARTKPHPTAGAPSSRSPTGVRRRKSFQLDDHVCPRWPRDGDVERAPMRGLAGRLSAHRPARLFLLLRGVHPHRGFDVQPARQMAEGDAPHSLAAADRFA